MMQDADEIIKKLSLQPHPEGGYFRETQRVSSTSGARSPGTVIYFLLKHGESSHWHRVDAAETWHFYAGAPLELRSAKNDAGPIICRTLGSDLSSDQEPQLMIEPHEWQAARTLGSFSLVGCTVSPGFEFSSFELAPPDWAPGK